MNRYDFVYLFDVTDGNPNGDPDAGNLPRVDPETQHGLVTDVCLKRKIRNFVSLAKNGEPGFAIYVREKAILNEQHQQAYVALKLDPKDRKSKGKDKVDEDRKLTSWMCSNFFDVRMFGAVMTTEINCGQVRGPVQFTLARSIEPILSQEHSVTRCAVTTAKEAEAQDGDNRTMGRKFTVPYGLYRCHGYVSPQLAAQTGFSDADLELLWKALEMMWDADHSAARGQMCPRKLIVFKHENPLGNAASHRLFEKVTIQRNDSQKPARSFGDYTIDIDRSMPAGVDVIEKF